MHVAHRKRKPRLDKEKVERRHRQHRRQHRRAAPKFHSHQHHIKQEKHDDVGQVKQRQHRRGQQRGQNAGGTCPGIAGPGITPRHSFFVASLMARNGPGQLAGAAGLADFNDVQRGRQSGQPAGQVGGHQPPQCRPAWSAGPAGDQCGAVQGLGLPHKLCCHIAAGQYGGGATEFGGQLEHGQCAVPHGGAQALVSGRLHVRRMPAHVELTGQPGGAAHRVLGALVWANTGQNRARGIPGRCVGKAGAGPGL